MRKLNYLQMTAVLTVAIILISLISAAAVYYFNEYRPAHISSYQTSATTECTFTDKCDTGKYVITPSDGYTYVRLSVTVVNISVDDFKISPTEFKILIKDVSQGLVYCGSFNNGIAKGSSTTLNIYYEVPYLTDPSSLSLKYTGEYSMSGLSIEPGKNPHIPEPETTK